MEDVSYEKGNYHGEVSRGSDLPGTAEMSLQGNRKIRQTNAGADLVLQVFASEPAEMYRLWDLHENLSPQGDRTRLRGRGVVCIVGDVR